MPHKLCKISVRSAQRFGSHSRKTHGGCTNPPPLARVKQRVVKWKEDAGFLAYQRFLKDLRVTYDTAEWDIALITRFALAAKDEAEPQVVPKR